MVINAVRKPMLPELEAPLAACRCFLFDVFLNNCLRKIVYLESALPKYSEGSRASLAVSNLNGKHDMGILAAELEHKPGLLGLVTSIIRVGGQQVPQLIRRGVKVC